MISNETFGFVPFVVANNTTSNTAPATIDQPHKPTIQSPQLQIHGQIKQKLRAFYESKKIPHLIFHGAPGSGKLTLVNEFISMIYQHDRAKIKSNVMVVNCSHGKGIKFIREELKFFAKTNIQTNSGVFFKTILLLNAHHLTIDAQSALRRCIELFSYNTRFFIVVENKNKLLNPILSRFCEIYVPEFMDGGRVVNLHQYETRQKMDLSELKRVSQDMITQQMDKVGLTPTRQQLTDMAHELYETGVSCMELVEWINTHELERVQRGSYSKGDTAKINMCYHKIKSEFRCEKLLMFYILDFVFFSDFEIPVV